MYWRRVDAWGSCHEIRRLAYWASIGSTLGVTITVNNCDGLTLRECCACLVPSHHWVTIQQRKVRRRPVGLVDNHRAIVILYVRSPSGLRGGQ